MYKTYNQKFIDRYDQITLEYRDKSLDFESLASWHKERLVDVLNHVKEKSKFYSKHLAHISPNLVDLNNLCELPFTTKDDLRDQMFDMMSGTLSDAAYYYETTGTTGVATPCPRDINESYVSNTQLKFAYEDVIKGLFPEGHKPILGILGPTEVHSFSDTLGSIAMDIGICHAKAWPGSPVIGFDKCLNLLKDLKIEIVATSPGQVMTLAKEAKKRGLDPLKDFSIKAFMLSGELCTNELVGNLESLWGAKVFNSLYGSQEAFVIASTTPKNTLRPHLLNYIFELVNPETGDYIGASGVGELVVTCLVSGIKPLIRYRTGDIVEITKDINSDSIFDAYEIKVVGRVRDSVRLNGQAYTAAQIESAILRNVTGCLGYQILISQNDGRDSIITKLEIPGMAADRKKEILTSVNQSIKNNLGCENTVMLVDDLSDHVNLGGWIKWKAARLIDTREGLIESSAELTPEVLLTRLSKS
jgi:phenylacetate-CoA ligase